MSNVPAQIRDKITAAADALVLEGVKKPTNDQVRNRMGGGSLSHISPVMREWRERREKEVAVVLEMPSDLKAALEVSVAQVWSVAAKLAEDNFEQARQEISETLEETTRERDEALQEIDSLEAAVTQLENNIASCNRALEEAVEKRAEQTKQNNELEIKLREVEASTKAEREVKEHLQIELAEAKKIIASLQTELVEIAKATTKDKSKK